MQKAGLLHQVQGVGVFCHGTKCRLLCRAHVGRVFCGGAKCRAAVQGLGCRGLLPWSFAVVKNARLLHWAQKVGVFSRGLEFCYAGLRMASFFFTVHIQVFVYRLGPVPPILFKSYNTTENFYIYICRISTVILSDQLKWRVTTTIDDIRSVSTINNFNNSFGIETFTTYSHIN